MRRITVPLGTLAAAAVLSVVIPGSAHAAPGVLVIDDRAQANPSGCYQMSSSVENQTAWTAHVLTGPGCTGELATTVHPGESVVSRAGRSVWID